MMHPETLLVDDNNREVRAIGAAFGRHGLPRPSHVKSGEQALVWSAFHPCTVCIVANDLPGMTGVETVERLHARQPALPIVMISHAHRETSQMAALSAGAAAYIAASAAMPEQVAMAVEWCAAGTQAPRTSRST